MKNLILILTVVLFGCSSIPSAPIPKCTQVEKKNETGLGAEKTVQIPVMNEPALIGGKPAESAQWQASVYARSGNASCSATLVGDRVLFMAAHCMADGGKVTFSAHANQYSATCAHHPEYRTNQTADWALCLVDRPVTGVEFENLGVTYPLQLNQDLLLSGYGCVKKGGGGGNDGIFRIGIAQIRGLPGGKSYDIVTRGGAALCFGDSGGSAYSLSEDGRRRIVGVNSRGDISTMSYLPSVAQKTFSDWAIQWSASSNNVKLCGLHSDALSCRGASNEGAPFEIDAKAACLKGTVKPEFIPRQTEIVDSLKSALDKF